MNEVFAEYSHYYDLLNSGKNYEQEAEYVLGLFNRFSKIPCNQVLNLGCGTGCHDLIMASKGCQITGVDRSDTMLDLARSKVSARQESQLSFILGNINDLRLERTFDLVLSLFHVVSYQTGNEALADTFRTAASHLKPGGLFIFDFWYGPAVLSDRPEFRVKSFENEKLIVKRTTEPVLHPNTNTVDVNFTIDITSKEDLHVRTLQETHEMRYLFLPEIEFLLEAAGLHCIHAEEWLTGKSPDLESWNVCCVAEKK